MEYISDVFIVTAGVALYYFAESFYYHVQARLEDRRMRLEIAAHEQYIRELAALKKNQRIKKTVQRF